MGAALGARIFVRSLLVQASWSFGRMQNLGFLLMVFPGLAARHRRWSPALAEDCIRHLRQFNTHAYLAGLVARVVLAEEAGGRSAGEVAGLERPLTCALGGIGDELFRGHLRPLAALSGLALALAGNMAAPLVMLAVYNVPHLSLRAWGVAAGLRLGAGAFSRFRSLPLVAIVSRAGLALPALAGFLVGACAGDGAWAVARGRAARSAAVSAGLFAVLAALQVRGLRVERILAVGSVLAVVAGALQGMRP